MPVAIRMMAGLSAAVALAGCAAQEGADPAMSANGASANRSCFYAPHVRGFRQGPNDSIIVNSNSRDYYILQPYHDCGNLNVRMSVAIRPRGSNYVCEGYDADLYVPDVLGPRYCPVRAVRKLTPAEVTALRASSGQR